MKDSSQVEVITDEVRIHLQKQGVQSREETRQLITNFLVQEKKLNNVEVTSRDWGKTEAKFYIRFSLNGNAIVENSTLSRQVRVI